MKPLFGSSKKEDPVSEFAAKVYEASELPMSQPSICQVVELRKEQLKNTLKQKQLEAQIRCVTYLGLNREKMRAKHGQSLTKSQAKKLNLL